VPSGFRPFNANNVEAELLCRLLKSRIRAFYFNVGKRNRRVLTKRRLDGSVFFPGDFDTCCRSVVAHVAKEQRIMLRQRFHSRHAEIFGNRNHVSFLPSNRKAPTL